MRFNEYFDSSEFDSPDVENSGELMHTGFINKLTLAREKANIPFYISSGYRSQEHNTDIGGAYASSHLKGLAADIMTIDSKARFVILKSLLDVGFNRIGIYEFHIHCDIDHFKPSEICWYV